MKKDCELPLWIIHLCSFLSFLLQFLPSPLSFSFNLQHSPPNILQDLFFSPFNYHGSFYLLIVLLLRHSSGLQVLGSTLGTELFIPQSPTQGIQLSGFPRWLQVPLAMWGSNESAMHEVPRWILQYSCIYYSLFSVSEVPLTSSHCPRTSAQNPPFPPFWPLGPTLGSESRCQSIAENKDCCSPYQPG